MHTQRKKKKKNRNNKNKKSEIQKEEEGKVEQVEEKLEKEGYIGNDKENRKQTKFTKSTFSSSLISADLDVPTARHLAEVLVQLQGFVHLVVGHAVAAQASLPRLVHLSEHHKLGHVRHRHQLPVQQVSEGHGLRRPRAVRQPEPENRDSRPTT